MGILLGGESEAHLGRGDRDELVRGLDHAGVQTEHGHGRLDHSRSEIDPSQPG